MFLLDNEHRVILIMKKLINRYIEFIVWFIILFGGAVIYSAWNLLLGEFSISDALVRVSAAFVATVFVLFIGLKLWRVEDE